MSRLLHSPDALCKCGHPRVDHSLELPAPCYHGCKSDTLIPTDPDYGCKCVGFCPQFPAVREENFIMLQERIALKSVEEAGGKMSSLPLFRMLTRYNETERGETTKEARAIASEVINNLWEQKRLTGRILAGDGGILLELPGRAALEAEKG